MPYPILGFLGHHGACPSKRNKAWHFACVLFVDATELFTQQFFFGSNTNFGADVVNDRRQDQAEPVSVGQAAGHEHAEHAGVNRMADNSVRPMATGRNGVNGLRAIIQASANASA